MKQILAICCLSAACLSATAQSINIKGKVTDGKEPIIGATISVEGSNRNAVTDIDGNYSIEVPAGGTLTYSYVGYHQVKKKVKQGVGVLNIAMSEDQQQMDEVVVTALNIKRNKRSLGYATDQITAADLNVGNETNMLNQLTGKVAGVQITAGNSGAGSSSRVIIRGESSLSSNNQPLYVVDGVPINNNTYTNLSGTPQEIDYGNGAGELNADDIASMTVLKGANAAALYGSRAANGVFEYWDGNNGHGTQDQQDMSWGREMDGSLVAQYDSPSVGPNGEQLRGGDVAARNGAAITPTPLVAHPNNVRDFFETGVTQNTNIALSASNSKGSVRLSYTNLYSKGAIPNVDLKRNTFSLNTTYDFTDRFHAKASATYTGSSSSNRPSMGYGPENPMYLFAWCARNMNIKAEREYWQRGYEGLKQYHTNSGWNDNPYFTMYENTNGFNKDRMFGNIMLSYDILPNLTLSARTGIDYSGELRQSKRAYSTQRFPTGAYKRENVYASEWNTDVLLQYTGKLSRDMSFNATVGVNSMVQKSRYDYGFANGLSVPEVYNLGNASGNVDYT